AGGVAGLAEALARCLARGPRGLQRLARGVVGGLDRVVALACLVCGHLGENRVEGPWSCADGSHSPGASSGIGAEIARAGAARSAELILVARGREKLESLAAELRSGGVEVSVRPADLADASEVEALEGELVADGLVPDVLVNNAGSHERVPRIGRVLGTLTTERVAEASVQGVERGRRVVHIPRRTAAFEFSARHFPRTTRAVVTRTGGSGRCEPVDR
ncbi:MAG: SDR family NAD(P)-dependent oxidoreductase, partial [Actinobacteria bacterium]|nr:SDR family NAD(P)-dependent oxidoreductase [Actinomycetota bacterium]